MSRARQSLGPVGRLRELWWSSLPLRMIAMTSLGTMMVLLLGNLVVLHLATEGVLEGKKRSAIAEASVAVDRMQTEMRSSDLRTSSLYERLAQLADEAAAQPNQYRIIIRGPVSSFVSPGIREDSLPEELAQKVVEEDGMFAAPTTVRWTDPQRSGEPGLAVGSHLVGPDGQEFPVHFIFPLTSEAQTLSVLRRAETTAGALLLLALCLVSWVVARHVVGQVRQASVAAEQIASGHYDERLPVHGTDDLASLATSLNNMAAELTSHITALEDLSRVQQRFVSDVSHELRTPLTTVRMAADMLFENREDLDPFAARATELMHDELDRFETMLGDLLEISRFDAGAAVLALELTDLTGLVAREVEAQRPLAERLGVEVALEAPSVAMVEMDPRRVRRVMRNLITNAIEHAERGPVQVRVAMDKSVAAVTVRDHGVGFESHQAEQVFHRFWRADPSRTRAVGGSGLGLAIALEDASLHGGWLKAWGRPGRGAQFLFVLPRYAGQVVTRSPLPLAPLEGR